MSAQLKLDLIFNNFSRLSGGSTHSEMLLSTLERKKKKGFLGKLKKLTKSSRSVDDGAEVLPSISHRQVGVAFKIHQLFQLKLTDKKTYRTLWVNYEEFLYMPVEKGHTRIKGI